MNKKQKKKLTIIIAVLFLLSIIAGLILYALKQNINLFYTPTQLANAAVHDNQVIRLGGYVKKGSIHFDPSGQSVTFIITDHHHEKEIHYHGVLPNLFRDDQGVVITGHWHDQPIFTADQVLAKHDEKYMPWSIEKELKKETHS